MWKNRLTKGIIESDDISTHGMANVSWVDDDSSILESDDYE